MLAFGREGYALRAEPVLHNEIIDFTIGAGTFGYYFPDVPGFSYDTRSLHVLDEAQAILDAQKPRQRGAIAAITACIAQFIDHDIVSELPLRARFLNVDSVEVVPRDRSEVLAALANERTGLLDLDSLYGRADNGVQAKMNALMRDPSDPARMRLGALTPVAAGGAVLPQDRAGDLPRLGQIMSDDGGRRSRMSLADLRMLPDRLRQHFLDAQGHPIPQRAVIGDTRNDETLAMAQMHMAFLRLHNAFVDAWPRTRRAGDAEAVFHWARDQMRWHFQWLVVNAFLPAICDAGALSQVMASQAALYARFLSESGAAGVVHRPIPLEFSTAAFAAARALAWDHPDWNRLLASAGSAGPVDARHHLLAYTGHGTPPMPDGSPSDAASHPTLPESHAIDWGHMVRPTGGGSTGGASPRVTIRDLELRRGMRLNLPSAQHCLAHLNEEFRFGLPVLGREDLMRGDCAPALRDGNFDRHTPLSIYIRREAETLGEGRRLGPLGTHLVGGTLVGLVMHDPASYWHRPGSDRGLWCPADGARPGGIEVESFPAMLQAAGLM